MGDRRWSAVRRRASRVSQLSRALTLASAHSRIAIPTTMSRVERPPVVCAAIGIPVQCLVRLRARLRAASEALRADFAARRVGVRVRCVTQVVATQAFAWGGEGQHDLIAEQQVVGSRSGGVDPARRLRLYAAERSQVFEFGAGGVGVEPGLDAVAVLLDRVRADHHVVWVGGGRVHRRHRSSPHGARTVGGFAADGISVRRVFGGCRNARQAGAADVRRIEIVLAERR